MYYVSPKVFLRLPLNKHQTWQPLQQQQQQRAICLSAERYSNPLSFIPGGWEKKKKNGGEKEGAGKRQFNFGYNTSLLLFAKNL